MMAFLSRKLSGGVSMNKTFAVAVVLVGVFALGFAANKSSTSFLGPRVVATVNLVNQTADIPVTTIFTPPITGLYRVSTYMTMTVSGHGYLTLNWTDNAGVESAIVSTTQNSSPPPYDYCNYDNVPCSPTTFIAKAGTPVSYSTQGFGSGSGTYEVYIVIERLE
jgi:hypothetical protein